MMRRRWGSWVFLICCWNIAAWPTWAAATNNYLPVTADQNALHSYPQRFDYDYGNDFLSLGGKKIPLHQFSLQVVTQRESPAIQFQWPDLFLTQTQIHLKNHFGKNILSFEVDETNKPVHQLLTDNLNAAQTDRLTKLPFVQFCVQQNQDEEFIEYCSTQYSLVKLKGVYQFVRRKSPFRQTELFLNFEKVSPEGVVILNKPSESLKIRFLTQTGETIQGAVKYKAIKILDVSRDPAGNFMLIRAEGTTPLKPTVARKIKDDVWEIRYKDTEPLFFKGFMGIPMRQDFEFIGTPLAPQNKPELLSQLSSLTYADPYVVTGKIPSGGKVQLDPPAANTPPADLKLQGNQFEWSLPTSLDTPHTYTLTYLYSDKNYKSEVTIQRVPQQFLRALAGYEFSKNTTYAGLAYQYWTESLFGMQHRFGFDGQYQQNLGTKVGEADTKETELRFLTKFSPGLLFQGTNLDFGVLMHFHQYEGQQKSYPGLSLGVMTSSLPLFSEHQRCDIKYVMGSTSTTTPEMSSLLSTSCLFIKSINPAWFITHEYSYNQYSYKPTQPTTPSYFALAFSLGRLF